MDEFNNRFKMVKERFSQMEDSYLNNIQTEGQRSKRTKRTKHSIRAMGKQENV